MRSACSARSSAFGVGRDDHAAIIAIDDDDFAAADLVQEVSQADDRRDFQGSGEDRGVAGGAADFGGEGFDKLGIEPGRLTGGQIVGQNDDWLSRGPADCWLPAPTNAAAVPAPGRAGRPPVH